MWKTLSYPNSAEMMIISEIQNWGWRTVKKWASDMWGFTYTLTTRVSSQHRIWHRRSGWNILGRILFCTYVQHFAASWPWLPLQHVSKTICNGVWYAWYAYMTLWPKTSCWKQTGHEGALSHNTWHLQGFAESWRPKTQDHSLLGSSE